MRIGSKLAQIRKQRGYTDEEVAKSLSLNIVKYRCLEEDITEFTIDVLLQLADVFGVSVDELLSRNSSSGNDLKAILLKKPTFDGAVLSSQDIQMIQDFITRLADQSKKLQHLIELIGDDTDFLQKLQDLKIINGKLDNKQLLQTIEKALA
ncbi:helix-turn-helix domain-containing protein [Paenibacillus validus]|nr:helix-turn-helix transcriptional regulator [Paenibacillus validus]